MKQTRRASLVESLANVAFGYGIALAANIVVLPWFGLSVSISQSASIALIFTLVSIARSFALRRMFEALRIWGVMP